LANAKSIPIANAIQARFDDLDYLFDIGEIDLNISGCMNACGHHHVGHIGVLGVDKNDSEFYQVTLGGRQGNDAKLGKVIGPSFAADEMPDVVDKIIKVYVESRHPDERFLDTFDRIGIDPFKNRVYEGRAHGKAKSVQGGRIMAQLIKHRAVAVDSWTTLEIAEGETPETVALPAGDVIFPLAVWQARKAEIISCHKRIGLMLQPDERVEDVAADLEYFVVIAVAFPKFVDGRGYSTAACFASATSTKASCAPSAMCCTTSFSSCSVSASTATP
jgi:hypothetical protein